MGLGRSKAHPRVIQVAPSQNQEAETPSAGPAFFALTRNLEEKSTHSLPRLQNQHHLEGQLPPLRETLYGRRPAVSRAMYFDIPLKDEETSIIKMHPPRRIQKLEPIDLPQVITCERLPRQPEARARRKVKQELEKKMQIPMYTSGKRQYLHKMQMLEINRKRQEAQTELRKSFHEEARINMQKLKGQRGKNILQSMPQSAGYETLTILPDETVHRGPGHSQDEDFLEYHIENDYYPQKIGKMETWLREQEVQGQHLWDSSSSESDELEKEKTRPQALVRTKTERIPAYDAFYDSE